MDATETVEAVPNVLPTKEMPPGQPDALTPPTSGHEMDDKDGSSSELSDAELMEDEAMGDIEPDHYWDGGKIPVFKPTMAQFCDFERFVKKIDSYGMKSGIAKVIPPKEWTDALPPLDDAIKPVRIKNPITQEFAGSHGCYVQANIEKQRSYNLPQWKALTEQSNHQPPARRGERRRAQEATPRTRTRRPPPKPAPADGPRRRGRPPKPKPAPVEEPSTDKVAASGTNGLAPPTPASPGRGDQDDNHVQVKQENPEDLTEPGTAAEDSQVKSISSRRKNTRGADAVEVDEAAFKDFDYRMKDLDVFSPERCKELENIYWKTVPSALPMYGADMAGSLFDDRTEHWNVAKLPNLLDVLGTKVPGVNSTYCYFGMWKATFAWHLEDVDLYSINYIHFGAPKQWYSISQADLPRFEAAMRSKWPNDYKNCSQFLRHKTYLISPSVLESQFNIKVNKLIHYEGEFVITYPFGYHSGFNLGYNCAESVNFATETWLEYGRNAKKCGCEADSVWVDVNEIERKLRGEPTPEFYETEVEYEEDDDDDGDEANLPSPDSTLAGKAKSTPGRKRKREPGAKEVKVKRIKILKKVGPCTLCPNDVPFDTLLPTDTGKKSHQLCALYTPETAVLSENGVTKVSGVADIDKARLGLKCNFCNQKFGACFQCSAKKCTRAYHATCAAEAGVQVDQGPVPAFDEDGTEYYFDGFDFRCRFHRPKRAKKTDIVDFLEAQVHIKEYALSLKPKDVVQAQYSWGETTGDLFCGVVVENRPTEMTVVIEILPGRQRIEVEWKWLLALDPAESLRPKPSASAVPLPSHLLNDQTLNSRNKDAPPEMDEPFSDPAARQKWREFHTSGKITFAPLIKVDLGKAEQLWYYLGRTSTEAKAQYTDNPRVLKHNPKSNFLDTVKPPTPVRKSTHMDPRRLSHGVKNKAIRAPQGFAGSTPNYPAPQYPRQQYPPRPMLPCDISHAQFPSAGYALSVNRRSEIVDPQLDPNARRSYNQLSPTYAVSTPTDFRSYYPQPAWTGTRPYSSAIHPKHGPRNSKAVASPRLGAQFASNQDYIKFIQKYTYLINSYLRRPRKYVSPYAKSGDFNAECELVKNVTGGYDNDRLGWTPHHGYQQIMWNFSSPPHGHPQSPVNTAHSHSFYGSPVNYEQPAPAVQQASMQMDSDGWTGSYSGEQQRHRTLYPQTNGYVPAEQPSGYGSVDPSGSYFMTKSQPSWRQYQSQIHSAGTGGTAPGHAVMRSPVRPEYSPLSDAGGRA